MRITGTLRGECDDGKSCPRVLDTDDPTQVLVQGDRVTDAGVREQIRLPDHEDVVRVPRALVDGTPRIMPRDEFGEWYDEHLTRDMLRLETLPYYDPDRLSFAEWQRGDREPGWDRKRPWLQRVRADADAGITRRRVRIVRGPLTEYERYECQWGYVPLVEHGEDIRILDLTDTPFPLAAVGDFSVFDDVHAIRMHYDDAGVFLGASVVERDVEFFAAVRDLLWRLAEPFGAWWARHPEHHRVGAYPL
jgi:hypothetical protein